MKASFCPSRSELLGGSVYLVLQATILPALVVQVIAWLPVSLSRSMTNLIVFAINFLAVICLFRRFLLKAARDFLAAPLWHLAHAALGLCAYFPMNFAGALLLQLLGLSVPNVNDSAIREMLEADLLPMAISTIVLAPLTEELLYRSLPLAPLYSRSKWAAYGLSVVLFSLAHVVGYVGTYDLQTLLLCFLQYIPPSLCLAWIYAKSQNVYVSTLVHTGVNTIGFLLLR